MFTLRVKKIRHDESVEEYMVRKRANRFLGMIPCLKTPITAVKGIWTECSKLPSNSRSTKCGDVKEHPLSQNKVSQGVSMLGHCVTGEQSENNASNVSASETEGAESTVSRDGESDKARKLFPERGGEKFQSSWLDIMFKGEGREGIDKIRCERNVYSCIAQSPLVKLMLKALRASGCPVDLRRHISCEVCDTSVTGGYDPYLNQVVVCQNTARSIGMIQGVLTHEMIHMFDFCRHKLDLGNAKHLACTEVRAANLAHCSFLSAFIQGTASVFAVKRYHQYCVKKRAFDSVKAVLDISDKDAWEAVEAVFDKCYADLEPIGRRIRRNSDHMERAYAEAVTAGYD